MIAKRESLPPVRVGITPERNDWRHEALCVGLDPSLFILEGQGAQIPRAIKRMCAACPSRQPCVDDAIRSGDQWAIRGGVGPRDRRGRKPGDNIPIRLAEEATA